VFDVSQSTVSRRWDLLRPLIGAALACEILPPSKIGGAFGTYLVDGTLRPTWHWKPVPDLYSTMAGYPGMNVQIAANLDGHSLSQERARELCLTIGCSSSVRFSRPATEAARCSSSSPPTMTNRKVKHGVPAVSKSVWRAALRRDGVGRWPWVAPGRLDSLIADWHPM
jgi:hypothetical protein